MCIFIGYCADHKAYKMYDHITHKLFAGRDVIFHEYAYDDDGQDVYLQVGMLYSMSMHMMMMVKMYGNFPKNAMEVRE